MDTYMVNNFKKQWDDPWAGGGSDGEGPAETGDREGPEVLASDMLVMA